MDPAADDTTAVLCGNGMLNHSRIFSPDWKPVLAKNHSKLPNLHCESTK